MLKIQAKYYRRGVCKRQSVLDGVNYAKIVNKASQILSDGAFVAILVSLGIMVWAGVLRV